jgi:hypothetical protein
MSRKSAWSKLWAKCRPKKTPEPDPVLDRACETLTLPQIFLLMTTNSNKTFFQRDYHVEHGPWNAHAFQALPLSQHNADSNDDGGPWQDVSASVAQHLGETRRVGEILRMMERVNESRKVWRKRMMDDVKGVEEGRRWSGETWENEG